MENISFFGFAINLLLVFLHVVYMKLLSNGNPNIQILIGLNTIEANKQRQFTFFVLLKISIKTSHWRNHRKINSFSIISVFPCCWLHQIIMIIIESVYVFLFITQQTYRHRHRIQHAYKHTHFTGFTTNERKTRTHTLDWKQNETKEQTEKWNHRHHNNNNNKENNQY